MQRKNLEGGLIKARQEALALLNNPDVSKDETIVCIRDDGNEVKAIISGDLYECSRALAASLHQCMSSVPEKHRDQFLAELATIITNGPKE